MPTTFYIAATLPSGHTAEIGFQRDTPGDDDVFVALEHDHVRSQLWCGSLVGAPGPRLRVLGPRGALVIEAIDQQEAALRAGADPSTVDTPGGWLVTGETRSPVDPSPGRWNGFYPLVRDALAGTAPMPVDPRDAVRTQRILDAARESARRRVVIELDPTD